MIKAILYISLINLFLIVFFLPIYVRLHFYNTRPVLYKRAMCIHFYTIILLMISNCIQLILMLKLFGV